MPDTVQHVRRIRAVYPELQITSVRPIEAGQYNDVIVADERWIFRFPRFAEGVRNLETETAILQRIQGAITLQIPNSVYTAFEPRTAGEVFAGYEMIPGEPLWRETLAGIDDEVTLDRLAMQLGCFLKELHSIPLAGAIRGVLPMLDLSARWSSLYAMLQTRLLPLMPEASRHRARAHFETFLDTAANFAVEPVLVHGDFGGSNILFDPALRTITGIIDFGSAHLGDPALDLAALATYGDPFLSRVRNVYPAPETFIRRMRFYLGTFALQEALYGVEHDDAEALQRGLAAYRWGQRVVRRPVRCRLQNTSSERLGSRDVSWESPLRSACRGSTTAGGSSAPIWS